MEDLASRITLASNMLKNVLDECELYLGVDAKTEDFIFMDKKTYPKGKFARVPMNEINTRY